MAGLRAAEKGATGHGRKETRGLLRTSGPKQSSGRSRRLAALGEYARMPDPRSAEGVTGRMRLAVGAARNAWWRRQ